MEEPGVIAEEEFPEWMRAAGWAPTTSPAEEAEKGAAQGEGLPAAGEEEAELATAEIPDWLRAMRGIKEVSAPSAPMLFKVDRRERG
jgi:hypothetical protein